MGYFSNGTEQLIYEETHCAKCANADDDGCVIMLVHLLHNYDECNNPDSILHLLIPRDEKGWNKQCAMFRP